MAKPLSPDDPILGPARGSIYTAHRFAMETNAQPARDIERYLDEVFRLAPLVGIDPAIVVAQSALETGNWTSEAWVKRRNPAGIGILGDPGGPDTDLGYAWKNGTDAARAQIIHLAVYRWGGATAWPDDVWKVLGGFAELDPRFFAVLNKKLGGTVRTIRDLNGKWATVPDYADRIAKRGNDLFDFREELMAITFGNVPHPPFEDRPIKKPEGFGQNDLGQRKPKGVVYHRMIGTLRGTDYYFRLPTTGALTDYGVGTAFTDGAVDDGVIIRWNDPRGRQSGWASGPWENPAGDGRAYVAKYGVDAINRDLISIEISGRQYTDPVSDKCVESVAQLSAYWADQCRVPWSSYATSPATALVFTYWHNEFQAHKPCPGAVVMQLTDRIIARTKDILKSAQEGTAPVPPTPGVQYPAFMDKDIATRMFGSVKGEDGKTYAYSEGQSISSLWLAEFGAWGWPAIKEVWSYDNGARRYVRFEAGTIFIGADGKPVVMED